MNLAQFRAIAPNLDRDMAEVFAKYGLKVDRRSASVDSTVGTVNFRVTLTDTNMKAADGSAATPERLRWEQHASMFGLKPEWLGATITLNGKPFTVTGLINTRGAKNIQITRADGKVFVTTSEALVRFFAARAHLAEKGNVNG